MWRRLPLVALAVAAVLTETSFPTGLLVPLTIFFTISAPEERGLWVAVSGGLLYDIFFLGPFGGYTLALLSVFGVTLALIRRWLTSQSFYALVGLALAGTIASQGVLYLYTALASITNKNVALHFSPEAIVGRMVVSVAELLIMVALSAAIQRPLAHIFMARGQRY